MIWAGGAIVGESLLLRQRGQAIFTSLAVLAVDSSGALLFSI